MTQRATEIAAEGESEHAKDATRSPDKNRYASCCIQRGRSARHDDDERGTQVSG